MSGGVHDLSTPEATAEFLLSLSTKVPQSRYEKGVRSQRRTWYERISKTKPPEFMEKVKEIMKNART